MQLLIHSQCLHHQQPTRRSVLTSAQCFCVRTSLSMPRKLARHPAHVEFVQRKPARLDHHREGNHREKGPQEPWDAPKKAPHEFLRRAEQSASSPETAGPKWRWLLGSRGDVAHEASLSEAVLVFLRATRLGHCCCQLSPDQFVLT